MFARVKKSGQYEYLQLVENKKVDKKTKQRVIATIGRVDELKEKGRIESLIRSLSRFSEKTLMILSGQSEPDVTGIKIGPALIFERLWEETGIKAAILRELKSREFRFDVERAVFLTVLHRLMVSGSDRNCLSWRNGYRVNGVDGLDLHHMYRAMNFLGHEIEDQKHKTPFSPRCVKDVIEESLYESRRDLFSKAGLVFFDTTSIYFEGEGSAALGRKGFNKDHRPDLNQMVVGAVIDEDGRPICCEMWPGNTTDVKTLLPVIERLRKRFLITNICIVADRGMISNDTLKALENKDHPILYILGVRMRNCKDVSTEVLKTGGRYREVHPESESSKDPSPLKVKEVRFKGVRYIVCVNSKQARKDANTRESIIESLEKTLKNGSKHLIGNKGYRKYLTVDKDSVRINTDKIKEEERFDGKWVLRTNTSLSPEQVALKYKDLWMVERIFRDVKTILETRPVFHQKAENIIGHVFCSFLALVLRKELDLRLKNMGHDFEWAQIKQNLKALQIMTISEDDKTFEIRTRCEGVCSKIFQAVGVAIPHTIKELH
jgi:transposase